MKKLKFDYLPLDKIDISISNVRKSNLEEGIDELAASIREIGVQQPVVVSQRGDRYELIIGQRRYLACKKLELKEIPALITTVKDETEATIKSFSENIHRLDLQYRDKMQVAIELLNRFGSIRKVADHLGVEDQTVRRYLGYEGVPEPIKKMVDEGKLGAITAIQIAQNIPDEKRAVEIAERVKETPRSEDRREIIDVAKKNPSKSPKAIVEVVKKQRKEKLTVDLTERVANALAKACEKYKSNAKDIALEAIEEWLEGRGFLE
jgi:ParB family chromosome partitioning protein